MPNLKTTLGVIKSHSSCESGWKNLCKTLGTIEPETEVTLLQILDSNGVQDAYWALGRCWGYRDRCLLIADVIDISEVRNHNCAAVRDMPDTIRRWYAGIITDDQLAAAAAASAAWVVCAAAAAASAAWAAEAAWAARAAAWYRNEKLMREFCGG